MKVGVDNKKQFEPTYLSYMVSKILIASGLNHKGVSQKSRSKLKK